MSGKPDPDLLTTAFELIAERGWRGFTRTELARRAGVSLDRVDSELPSRGALLSALGKRIDREMLAIEVSELDGLSPRERVFELIMRRLEALRPFKAGLRAMGRERSPDLELVAHACCNAGRSVGWLLDASGVELGELRRAGAGPVLALVYGRVFNVWLGDDSEDLAGSMAELDKRLSQAETLAQWTAWLDGRARRPDPQPG